MIFPNNQLVFGDKCGCVHDFAVGCSWDMDVEVWVSVSSLHVIRVSV